MSAMLHQVFSTSLGKFASLVVIAGLFMACNFSPGFAEVSIYNFANADLGLCSGGLKAKISSSGGKVIEIPIVAQGKSIRIEASSETGFYISETVTVEAWCNTGTSTEGYSKVVGHGGYTNTIFDIVIKSPATGTPKPSHEITSPGPIIVF